MTVAIHKPNRENVPFPKTRAQWGVLLNLQQFVPVRRLYILLAFYLRRIALKRTAGNLAV